ncbi:hypothetical protein HZH68_011655 [Vespula germanica]|uniref:SH2 domain-containing protein n=1 Tax=Vespula germanica TaxID=30212 RepID=A0A834JJT6_VESGE|nr:hypothetical protein HZH68_011655 [Vespula germanica]
MRKHRILPHIRLEPPQTPVHVDGYCIKTVQEEEEEKEKKEEEEEEEEEKEELLANSNRFRISENLQWNVLEMVYSEQYLFGTTRHHGDDDEDDDDEDDDYLSLENWRTIDCPRRQQQIDMSNLPTKGPNHHHESSMVKQTRLDKEQIAEEIADKLGYAPGVSYSEIAKRAADCDYEPRAQLQVPLLLTLGEERAALHKAVESGNTDLVYTVILHLRENMTLGDFQMSIMHCPLAMALYIKYCQNHNRETLRDIYNQYDDFHSQAIWFITESYQQKSARDTLLQSAQENFKLARNDTNAALTEEQIKLLRYQRSLEETLHKTMVGKSLHDTVKILLLQNELKLADKLRSEYRIPERRYWWLRIQCLAEKGLWNELEKLSKSKKSPIGYEPFIDQCLKYNQDQEGKKYLPRVQDELKVKYLVKLKTRAVSPIRFTFDENLVDDTSGKLLPNKLTVDNLTIDWLRSRLTELETSLKATQQNRQNPQFSPENNSDSKISALDYSNEREELRLRCQEKKLQRQVDVIRAALNELGCEELPSGCDLSMEGSYTDPPTINKKSTVADNGLFTLRRNQRFLTIIKSPFKSLPSISDSKNGLIRASSEGVTTKADSVPPVVPLRYVSHLTNNQKGNGNGDLMEEEWFHGVLPREEVVRLLVNEGDFLVRETTRNDECQIVLSVCWDGHKHFIVQTTQE